MDAVVPVLYPVGADVQRRMGCRRQISKIYRAANCCFGAGYAPARVEMRQMGQPLADDHEPLRTRPLTCAP
jgi:hypothetical protein